jgi:hypothetical protein
MAQLRERLDQMPRQREPALGPPDPQFTGLGWGPDHEPLPRFPLFCGVKHCIHLACRSVPSGPHICVHKLFISVIPRLPCTSNSNSGICIMNPSINICQKVYVLSNSLCYFKSIWASQQLCISTMALLWLKLEMLGIYQRVD